MHPTQSMLALAALCVVLCASAALAASAPDPSRFAPARAVDPVALWEFQEGSGTTLSDTGRTPALDLTLDGSVAWEASTAGVQFSGASPVGAFAAGSSGGVSKIFGSTSSPYGWNYTTEVWSSPDVFPAPGSSQTLFQLCDSSQDFEDASLRPPCIKQGLFSPAASPSSTSHSFAWQLVYEPIGPSFLNKQAFGFSHPLTRTSSLRHSVARYTTTSQAAFGTLGPGYAIGEMFLDGAEASDAVSGSRITNGLPINMWETQVPRTLNTWDAHPLANRAFTMGYSRNSSGSALSGSQFTGKMYLVALYDRALSDADVAANYAAGPPTTAPTTTAPLASPAATAAENTNATWVAPGSDPDSVLGWDTMLSARIVSVAISTPIAAFFPTPASAGALYDADGVMLTVGDPASLATLLGNPGPSLTFVPSTGFYGDVMVEYATVDARRAAAANTFTATLTYTNVEHAPVALASANSTVAGSSCLVELRGSDLDPESLLWPTVTSLPDASLYGSLSRVADGAPVVANQVMATSARTLSVLFTPRTNLGLLVRVPSIAASFTFKLTDSLTGVESAEAEAIVTIANNAVSPDVHVMATEDTALLITLQGSDLAEPGASLTYTITQAPGAGSVEFVGSSVSSSGVTVRFMPGTDFFGIDLFRYSVTSSVSLAESVPGTVFVNVTNVNDAPRPLSYQTEFFWRSGNTTFDLRVNEVDNDPVTYSVFAPLPSAAEVTLEQVDSSAPVVTAPTLVTDPLGRLVAHAIIPTTPSTQGYSQDVVFNAVDDSGVPGGVPGAVRVFVKNDLWAGNVTSLGPEDTVRTIVLPTDDYFGRPYTVYLTSLPALGSLSVNDGTGAVVSVTDSDLPLSLGPGAGATLIYTPNTNAVFENDAFGYEVRDGEGRGEVVAGLAFVTTTPVPDPPYIALNSPDPLVILDGKVLEITQLVVAEVDDDTAIVDVNITAPAGALVSGDGVVYTQSLTVSTTSRALVGSGGILAPLRFKTNTAVQTVTQATPMEVSVSAMAQGEVSDFVFVINVVPDPSSPDASIDGTLVAGVAAAAGTALLFGAVLAYILYVRAEKEPKLPPPPSFEPYVFDEARLLGPNGMYASKIAPVHMLNEFTRLVVEPGYPLVFALFEVTPEALIDDLCERLVFVFASNSSGSAVSALDLVASVAEREIAMAPRASALFRSNSRACKLHSVYAKVIGLPYLYNTLGPVFMKLTAQASSMEVDESKVRASQRGAVDVRVNKWQLLVVAQTFLKAIVESLDSIPYAFRQLAHTLSHNVSRPAAFPERRTGALGTFFFLRFVCPAVAQPEAYGLMREVPSSDLRRLLVLVAKTLQNLANGSLFVEEHLEPMNVFIRSNWDHVGEFLDDMAEVGARSGEDIVGLTVSDQVFDASVGWLWNSTQSMEHDLRALFGAVGGSVGGALASNLESCVWAASTPAPLPAASP